MNDDQITQSVNNLVNQTSATGAPVGSPSLGLGSNPSAQNPAPPPTDPDPPAPGLVDSPQPPFDTVDDPKTSEANSIPNTKDVRSEDATSNDGPPVEEAASDEATTTDDTPLSDTTQSIDHGQDHGAELDTILRRALTQLSPLVGKLDQPPEEKYRTLIMMIQATDDQSLIQAAYDAANQIADDTKKAEAMLGIVNEINYFTKKNSPQNQG